ncbi:hypothetical protein GXP67_16815 [Rhodocytophaga rosea]|uniref:FUSC family protein n=1 Tax=Rhodocytophaga rosea TaxID=2704465 RepID=A0A6C0GJM4_9BACT|nr:hypothetical protein [Rhodocytophaga rosea]QHT68185.1 hypothetical protein GXP67_16815 [Rhodocytophaga rosea]
MLSNKDYSQMRFDELLSEEKKIKSRKTIIAVLVGLVIGIAVWAATHKGGFFLTIILLAFSLLIGSRYLKNLKGIQAEISRRNTV